LAGTGKWTQPGVPHKGWSCADIEDLGEPSEICEMCETQEIRYVHIMEHPDYAEALRVGCICAGHMEEDLERAQLREKTFKAGRQRRARWLSRTWRCSQRGNEFLNVSGFNVVVFRAGGGWCARVAHRNYEWSHQLAPRGTAAEAKLAALDVMVAALDDISQQQREGNDE
jgi:hypothetical protein